MANSELQSSNSFVNINNCNDSSGEFFMPDPSSLSQQLNSPNSGTKRKASYDQNINNIPHKQPALQKQGEEMFCDICNVQLNSISQALQHRHGKAHLNKVKKVEGFNTLLPNSTEQDDTNCSTLHLQVNQIPPSMKQLGSVNPQCIICQKLFNSESQAMQHFQSQKHKQRVQSIGESTTESITALGANASLTQGGLYSDRTHHSMAMPGNGEGFPHFSSTNAKTTSLHCQPCGLTMNSVLQMNTHVQGAKHKNNVAMLNDGLKSLSQNELRCVDCVMTFNSQTQMIQHMTSPKHLNKVQKKQTTGQFAGPTRGRGLGRGQGRGRGEASRGGQDHRGRGRARPPPLASSFVKADIVTSNHGNPIFPRVQSTAITPLSPALIGGPPFQHPFT